MSEMVHPNRLPPQTPYRESVWILPESDIPSPLRLDSTGTTRRDPTYRISRPDGAHYYVLEYIVAGQGHLYIAGEHFQPESGDVYLLPPGVPHEYYTRADDPWEKIWFNITGELIDRLVECYKLSGVVYLKHTGLHNAFRDGMEAVRRCQRGVELELALGIHRIMGELHRQRGNADKARSPVAVTLKEYLDRHWNEPFSLAALSAEIGKSPAQTLRIFKNEFQTTPGVYHTRRKLAFATEYLRNTSYSVRVIAGWLGFANEFHFSNWFKLQSGYAPKLYREAFRRGEISA